MSNTTPESDKHRTSPDLRKDDTTSFVQHSKESEMRLLNSGIDLIDKTETPTTTPLKYFQEDANFDNNSQSIRNDFVEPKEPSKALDAAQKNRSKGFLAMVQSKPKPDPKSTKSSDNTIEKDNVVKLELSYEKSVKSPNQPASKLQSGNNTPRSSNIEIPQKINLEDNSVNPIKPKLNPISITKNIGSATNSPAGTPPKTAPAKEGGFFKKTGSKLMSIFIGSKNDNGEEPQREKARPMTTILQKISKPLQNTLIKRHKEHQEELEDDKENHVLESLGNDIAKRTSELSHNSSDESEISEDEAQALRNLSKKRTKYGVVSGEEEMEHDIPKALITFVKDKITGDNLIPTAKAVQKDPRLRILLEKHAIKKKKNNDIKNLVNDLKNIDGKYMRACVKLRHKCGSVIDLFTIIYYKWRRPFDPKKPFKMFWDISIGIMIFWSVAYIPFEIAFGTSHHSGVRGLEIFITILFFIDILFSFHTGYYKDVHFIQSHRKIFKNYFFGWFWVDFVSSLPIGTLFLQNDAYDGTPLLRLWNVLKIARVFKLARILKIKKTLDEFRDTIQFSQLTSGLIRFIRLFFTVLFIAHCVACIWFYISKVSVLRGQEGWITTKLQPDDDISTQYLTSLYWTITTMMTVGYGDITPVSQSEKVVTMFVMLFGCGVFGYCINKVAEILSDVNREYSYQSTKMFFLNRFLRSNQIDFETQNKARDYLKFVFEVQAESQVEEMEVVDMLSENLKEVLTKAVNGHALKKCKIIKNNFSNRFISLLSGTLENKIYAPDEIIFNEGEYDNECLYFIKRGQIETFIKKYNLHLRNLGHDTCFGESSFMTQESKHYSAKSVGFSSIVVLKLSEFLRIAQDFQSEKEMYHMIKDRINFYKEFMLLSSKCQLCQRITHNLFSCPLLFPQKDISTVIDAYLKDLDEFRSNFERLGQRTQSFRKNLKYYQQRAEYCMKVVAEKKIAAREAAAKEAALKKAAAAEEAQSASKRADVRRITRRLQQDRNRKNKNDIDLLTDHRDSQETLAKLTLNTMIYEDDYNNNRGDLDDLLQNSPGLRASNSDKNLFYSPKNELLIGALSVERSNNAGTETPDRSDDDYVVEKLQSIQLEEEQEVKRLDLPMERIEEHREEHEDITPKQKKSGTKNSRANSSEKSKPIPQEKAFIPQFMLRLPPKFIQDDFEFDRVCNFEIYLPQNNVSKIADDIDAKFEKRKKIDIGLYTPNEVNIFKLKLGRIMNNLKKRSSAPEKQKTGIFGGYGPLLFGRVESMTMLPDEIKTPMNKV